MKRVRGIGGIFLLALALAGCATSPPGEDPRGQDLRNKGKPVLVALAKFHKAKGRYPASLHELVPAYMGEVPFELGLNLDHEAGQIYFVYSTSSWPRTSYVGCAAMLGQTEWTCRAGDPGGTKASGHY